MDYLTDYKLSPEKRSVLRPRQWQVAALIYDGRSNREIAEHLGLSCNTVRIHVSSILRVIGGYSRTDVAVFYHKWRHR